MRFVYQEGVVCVEGYVNSINDEQVAADDEEGANHGLEDGCSRFPLESQGEEEGGDDHQEVELKKRIIGRVREVVVEVGGQESL